MPPDKLRASQEDDEFAGRVLRMLGDATDERDEGIAVCIAPEELAKFYVSGEGVLMRKDAAQPEALIARHRQERHRIVLPEALQSIILKGAHDDLVGGGHMGYESTLVKIQYRYYWPTLKKDVRHWCKTCAICQRLKVSHRKQPFVSGTLQTPEARPCDLWYAGLVGELNPTFTGSRYTINSVDAAARFLKLLRSMAH